MQMKVTEQTNGNQKLEGWLDLHWSDSQHGSDLIVIDYLSCACQTWSKLFNRLFAKTSNNKALEQLFSTVIYAAILSIGLLLCLGARAK
jgi:hypothetical protein